MRKDIFISQKHENNLAYRADEGELKHSRVKKGRERGWGAKLRLRKATSKRGPRTRIEHRTTNGRRRMSMEPKPLRVDRKDELLWPASPAFLSAPNKPLIPPFRFSRDMCEMGDVVQTMARKHRSPGKKKSRHIHTHAVPHLKYPSSDFFPRMILVSLEPHISSRDPNEHTSTPSSSSLRYHAITSMPIVSNTSYDHRSPTCLFCRLRGGPSGSRARRPLAHLRWSWRSTRGTCRRRSCGGLLRPGWYD